MQPRVFEPNSDSRTLLPGERAYSEGNPVGNRILLALPEAEYQTLRPFLSLVDLPHRASLQEPGEKLEFAYFPNRGLVSLLVPTRKGKTIEVGAVGNEGLFGMAAVVGLDRSPQRAVVQIAGEGFRARVDALRSLLPSTPQLQLLSTRHVVIQGMQAAQSAACNRLHGIEQRLARWLLIMQDRVEHSSLLITHDNLATILGTDRPSVSLAAGTLQRKGAIDYTRGVVNILSREKIEEAACECYEVMRQFTLGLK